MKKNALVEGLVAGGAVARLSFASKRRFRIRVGEVDGASRGKPSEGLRDAPDVSAYQVVSNEEERGKQATDVSTAKESRPRQNSRTQEAVLMPIESKLSSSFIASSSLCKESRSQHYIE